MNSLKTKLFLDSGDPQETQAVLDLTGFLDGQTTNPSLVSKNPEIVKMKEGGQKLTQQTALEFYKKTVQEISKIIPNGSVSIEVIADKNTTSSDMISQARDMYTWIPNAHVKLPTTKEGLTAAETLLKDNFRINFTLVFAQSQAAAIYKLCENTTPGQIIISPFVGRLDDIGENGMDLIKNCIHMKKEINSPVEVLSASIRTLPHLLYTFALEADIATIPFKMIKEWKDAGSQVPESNYTYDAGNLKPIEYKTFDFTKSWDSFDIAHPLTDKGIEKFTADWNSLIN